MKLIKPKFWDQKNLGFFSFILLPFSLIYIVIANIYKFFQKEKKYSVPIICVGNIYIGGTEYDVISSEPRGGRKRKSKKKGGDTKDEKDEKDKKDDEDKKDEENKDEQIDSDVKEDKEDEIKLNIEELKSNDQDTLTENVSETN